MLGVDYRLSALKYNGFLAGLTGKQDVGGHQSSPAVVHSGLGIDSTMDNYYFAIVGISVGMQRPEVGRGVAELAEGSRGGGEFEEGVDGGVGHGKAQNGTVKG